MDYFNPSAITGGSGTVTERYSFSAFGLRTMLNSSFVVQGTSECEMKFSFQGQFLDVESGLMNYGYRYYVPHLGRWACKDPIGIEGGLNVYFMTANDAINQTDYFGLVNEKVATSVYGPFNSITEAAQFGAQVAQAHTENEYNNPGTQDATAAQHEYGGRVCRCEKTDQIGITPVRTDYLQGGVTLPECPENCGWKAVGGFHSHPLLGGALSHGFSGQDVDNIDNANEMHAVMRVFDDHGFTYQGDSTDKKNKKRLKKFNKLPNFDKIPMSVIQCEQSKKQK